MLGMPTARPLTTAACRLMILLAAFCVSSWRVQAGDEPEAVPPGIIIEPEPQKPGMNDEDDDDEGPDGPGCPVNQRPLELLV